MKIFILVLMASAATHASVVFTEDFNDFSDLTAAGWTFQNNSVSPGNPWFADTHGPIPGLSDPSVSADFSSTDVNAPTGGNISNWMLTPQLSFDNGYVLNFYTSSVGDPPDRLEIRLSTNGGSGNVGNTDVSVGDFTVLLLSINSTLAPGGYPVTWTQYSITLSGLSGPTSGRFGFRYFVTDGGIGGANSNSIGVDLVQLSNAVPEPPAIWLCAGGLAAMAVFRGRSFVEPLRLLWTRQADPS